VIFRNELDQNDHFIDFELVNVCSVTNGLLAKWSSYPLDLPGLNREMPSIDPRVLQTI
jgi:hypothetical protein